ncbi:MAG: CRTAC1 family protein, partial [Spirosomaceae bacterium]|nr:CRTAC1 family protein [Spirosomataceae bacterium]
FDNDGFEDVFVTSGMLTDILYKNNGDGTFTNVYEKSGLALTKKYVTQGAAAADVNRDGFVDLFVTTITTKDKKKVIPRAINLLFLNNGDGTFRDATAEFKLDKMNSFSTGASFGDFNADGWPDLYVGNYFNEFKGELSEISDATVVGANQISEGYLLLNNEGKSFTNVYKEYGLDFKGFGFGGVFTDFDNDGDQDLIINHDFGYKRTPNLVLENLYPKKKFQDVAKKVEMDLKINSMGTAVGDYDGNGFMDYFFTNIRFNRFMVNNGMGKPFTDKVRDLGMNFVAISWGTNFADFDHDGDVDLFVANGDLNPNCVPMGNYYFQNLNGKKFQEDSRAVGLNDYGIGRGSVTFDMDNDGDLDLFVVNQIATLPEYPTESFTRLYRNDSTNGNWLKIKLKGINAESQGIGSRITVVANGKRMIREIDGGGSSHLSQNSTIAHFGLSSATVVDSIIVNWSGGNEQILLNQPINQLLQITETAKPKNYFIQILLCGIFLLAAIIFLLRKKNTNPK